MTGLELRQKYLDFFKKKGHTVITSSSLIPENDPSVLFTAAGMHPLVPFLLGEQHPGGKRLTNYQKCIRTGDIEEVGDNWHLTFFEMLGNWSLGDYWKKEAIEWSFEFLTKELKIKPERLAVSVFAGDKDASFDQETYKIWLNLGIPESRIYKYGKEDNWWGPAGNTGPCGPDTEMFYITDKKPCGPNCQPNDNCGRFAEIWNDVFMEYNKTAEGKFISLKQKNVDTGMGLERTVAVLNNKSNVYDTEFFVPIIKKIHDLTRKRDAKSERIIADHLRAACFILADGITPSNLDQGYVLRRLIRRTIVQERNLDIGYKSFLELAKIVIEIHVNLYPELKNKEKLILEGLEKEEIKFSKSLEKGLKEFNKYYKEGVAFWGNDPKKEKIALEKLSKKKGIIPGLVIFNLYTTYGFPIELIREIAKGRGLLLDEDGYKEEFKKHKDLSRKGAEKKFAGGLADHSIETTKLHTATHLLHQALRIVLGNHVAQKGSNINPERLRFDFSHPNKLTAEEKQKVEEIVNQQIQNNLPVSFSEMTVEQAKKEEAIGLFEQKYGDKVKVYSIGNFSKEICGGPHVENTSKLKSFKIIKEEAVSAGVRRIKAVLQWKKMANLSQNPF